MKNWRTTAAGLIGAVIIGIVPVIKDGKINWEAVTVAAVIAVAGFLQKDKQVTGGSVKQ